jgi:DNA mismatch endonuclease (patch repair protein)
MVDIFSKRKRSEIMSNIGPKHSTQELIIRKLVFSMGYRYRLHRKALPGNPDIVFPKYKRLIFVHGCFWHGHKNCKRAKLPATNRSFWKKKINKNVIRDKYNYAHLRKLGWKYLVIWQCQIKNDKMNYMKSKIDKLLSS